MDFPKLEYPEAAKLTHVRCKLCQRGNTNASTRCAFCMRMRIALQALGLKHVGELVGTDNLIPNPNLVVHERTNGTLYAELITPLSLSPMPPTHILPREYHTEERPRIKIIGNHFLVREH